MLLIITKKENYLQYVQYTEHAASGLPNPTHLEGEVRFIQAQNQLVTTHSLKKNVAECLLTRSMLIQIYVPVYGMYMYIVYLQSWSVSRFHADVYVVYLVFQIA